MIITRLYTGFPRINVQFWVCLLLFAIVYSVQPSQAESEKTYLRVDSSTFYNEDDPQITSLGFLGFNERMEGHVDLAYVESDEDGSGLAIEAGGGYAYHWGVKFYAGIGISLGFNDEDDFITAYYPEAGIVVDITSSVGLTINRKRYFNLYGNTEDIIMLGLVFSMQNVD